MEILMYTPSGHIIGMLDRDQRTAKIPITYTKNNQDLNPNCLLSASCENQHTQSQCRNQTNNREQCIYLRRSMQRLKQVLVVGTYLLIVIPNVLSAPTRNMDSKCSDIGLLNPPEKWILDPINYTEPREEISKESLKTNAQEYAKMIYRKATTALDHANDKLEKYTQDQFHMSPANANKLYNREEHNYSWLPTKDDVPKEFGQHATVGPDVKMNDALVNLYQQFQKVAVGLVQIVWDYEHRGANANQEQRKEFITMEADLIGMLADIQSGIASLELQQPENITKDIMPNRLRCGPETERSTRDWIIYRDYINLLEYTKTLFENFKNADLDDL